MRARALACGVVVLSCSALAQEASEPTWSIDLDAVAGRRVIDAGDHGYTF